MGNVSFDKSNEWYASASLFVNTSLPKADGLPNAFIQAWYNGAVVLSLYHDPNGWITKERLGFCANDDFDALVANTIELMNNPAELKQMSDLCRAFAYETFAREEIVQSYSDIFFNKCH